MKRVPALGGFSGGKAPNKSGYPYIFLFLHITYVVGTHKKRLGEALLMSTHNMFLWRNKKNISTFWLKKVSYLELWTSTKPTVFTLL